MQIMNVMPWKKETLSQICYLLMLIKVYDYTSDRYYDPDITADSTLCTKGCKTILLMWNVDCLCNNIMHFLCIVQDKI